MKNTDPKEAFSFTKTEINGNSKMQEHNDNRNPEKKCDYENKNPRIKKNPCEKRFAKFTVNKNLRASKKQEIEQTKSSSGDGDLRRNSKSLQRKKEKKEKKKKNESVIGKQTIMRNIRNMYTRGN